MSRDLDVEIAVERDRIMGALKLPDHARALVLLAHGSGGSRQSPRERFVAEMLGRAGFGTLLLDLLTPDEERIDDATGHFRFDIALLASRVVAATDWLRAERLLPSPQLGYLGDSTGAAAALVAAAKRPSTVGAVVSQGGRPDLASGVLGDVWAPTLLVVGADDDNMVALNEDAWRALAAHHKDLRIIPGASHLFEEPGALDQVADLAREWFDQFLAPQPAGYLPVEAR
jgi:dienelactone hydrolase